MHMHPLHQAIEGMWAKQNDAYNEACQKIKMMQAILIYALAR